MKVLVIGGGGREHALAWKLSISKKVKKVFVAPGNSGINFEKKIEKIDISSSNINTLLTFSLIKSIDLIFVGSELPLSLGVVNLFTSYGFLCLGPRAYCSNLESSKIFSKNFMKKNGIFTANYSYFSNVSEARKFYSKISFPVVIKVDGLASGKGVIIVNNKEEYFTSIDIILRLNYFGKAGNKIIVEEFLYGKEISFIAICDGFNAVPMVSSRDHKPIFNKNGGYNTGGMGAFSPVKNFTSKKKIFAMDKIISPILLGMKKEKYLYVGFLYAGLIISNKGKINVLEFNCRFGDPETQPIMLRLKNDIFLLALENLKYNIVNFKMDWRKEISLGIILSSKGYPLFYKIGYRIFQRYIKKKNFKIFYSGVINKKEETFSFGGRVLCVTSLGKTLTLAQKETYMVISKIKWGCEYYRNDIGKNWS